MEDAQLIDYGMDKVPFPKGKLFEMRVLIVKENFSFARYIKEGLYRVVPNDGKNVVLEIDLGNHELIFHYTSPYGREQCRSTLNNIKEGIEKVLGS